MNMLEILLASQSPRRRELLSSAGYEFRVFPVKVSEIIDENLTPQEVVLGLARIKAQAALEQCKHLFSQDILILTADTVVTLAGRVLGKPKNKSEAQEFLRLLSAKTHSVMTGVVLQPVESGIVSARPWSGHEETMVEFKALSEAAIVEYVDSGEPMDKAGAYAIQGLGGRFVSSFSGSKSNVVGLPLELLERAVKENGWNVRRRTP